MSLETEELSAPGIWMLCTCVMLYGYLKKMHEGCKLLPPVDLEGRHKQKLKGDSEL